MPSILRRSPPRRPTTPNSQEAERRRRLYSLRYVAFMGHRIKQDEEAPPAPAPSELTFGRSDITFDRSDITFDQTEE